ncbi:MAG: 6,7-dimethyl-8-ribityllumazine synthase [Acidimicrobiia bacterium]|nr:6,7-dimethyl-8-ribityllumazine synthase [Acidimicrobiia bacterium]
MGTYARHEGRLVAGDARFAVVASRFNKEITDRLLDGALAAFGEHGVTDDHIEVFWVPGAFELPLVAQHCAGSGEFDAVVCVGAVVRGGTPHFDYVAGAAARGVMTAALATGVPVVFGVLTTDDEEQALARAGGTEGNKGEEAAVTALEMADLMAGLRDGSRDGEVGNT